MKTAMMVVIAATMMVIGCGDDDTGGSGSGDTSTSSSESCDEKHSCIGGGCQCDEGPNKGNACCNPDDSSCTENKCDSYCKYCS